MKVCETTLRISYEKCYYDDYMKNYHLEGMKSSPKYVLSGSLKQKTCEIKKSTEV